MRRTPDMGVSPCNSPLSGAECHRRMIQRSERGVLSKFAPALLLLTVSFVINYVDRGNISVAAPLIKSEFRLSDSQLAILSSAFFCTYPVMPFLLGWLVDRFDANWILASGFLTWSIPTASTRPSAGLLSLRRTT